MKPSHPGGGDTLPDGDCFGQVALLGAQSAGLVEGVLFLGQEAGSASGMFPLPPGADKQLIGSLLQDVPFVQRSSVRGFAEGVQALTALGDPLVCRGGQRADALTFL